MDDRDFGTSDISRSSKENDMEFVTCMSIHAMGYEINLLYKIGR